MEIKKDKKVVITGAMICKIVGFVALICGVALFVKGVVTDSYDYPAMAVAFASAIILLGLYKKRSA